MATRNDIFIHQSWKIPKESFTAKLSKATNKVLFGIDFIPFFIIIKVDFLIFLNFFDKLM
jgi:hypothetical protein